MNLYEDVMLQAYELATHSPDPSTQTSAIIVDVDPWDSVIIGRGFNHFPDGVSEAHWHGPKEAKYARVVHAEVAAIIDVAKHAPDWSTVGTTMVAPWAACANCAKHIADAGIKTLVRHAFLENGVDETSPWYQDVLVGDEIMREAGIEIIEVPLVPTDVRIRRNGALWPTD